MKDVLVLLMMMLGVHTLKQVLSLPYHVEPNRKCNNPDREYLLEASGLCCKKCPPGSRLTHECNGTSESVCEPCQHEQYMESWNYAPNCFPCAKCKAHKGLQVASACSPSAMSKCACRPGMYCFMYSDEHCTACHQHTSCKAGHGVFMPGTADSNVKCKRCRNGTFSDTSSTTEPCRPHTNCYGRPVLREGTSTSDTVCKPGMLPHTQTSVVSGGTVDPFSEQALLDGSLSSSLTKSPGADGELAAAVASIVATVMFFVIIAIILLVLYKTSWTKGTAHFNTKDITNEHNESCDEVQIARTSFVAISPREQHCLLQSTEISSSHDSGDNTASSHSSQESIGGLHPQHSPSGSSVHSCTFSPVSAGPHVNVNITFNIGDGGSPIPPGDLKLCLGQEEDFSMPKQETGKELPASWLRLLPLCVALLPGGDLPRRCC